jgi:hypothetical protein
MPTKNSNGAREASDAVSTMLSALQAPTANSLLMSQRIALESAKFWARRMHAYADQMETLSTCSSPDDFAGAQTRFLERMRDDYAAESEAIGALLTPERRAKRRNGGDVDAEA